MAFTGNYMCTSFKKELMYGAHDFDASSGDTFKIALYTNSAALNAATTAFTTSGESSGTNYTSGGNTLTRIDPTSAGTTGFTDFADTTWSNASFTARGALIYNTTPNTTSISLTNPAILVLDFGSDKVVSSGSVTVVFPTFDATNAIVRIA